jgi:hypothetical protein
MLVCMLPRHVGRLIVFGCVVVAAAGFVCLVVRVETKGPGARDSIEAAAV